jgi:dolichyl-phosphate beta-glucosyltransferase
METPYLSVIIPAFNEGGRIEATLGAVGAYLRGSGHSYEIIVVDDGSTDATATVVKDAMGKVPYLRLLRLGSNEGKGAAVRAGMLQARGDARLFMDADNSTNIDQVVKLLTFFKEGYDVVIGSRKIVGAEIQVAQSVVREALGTVYRATAHALVGLPFSDTQNGFKLFSGTAALALFSNLQTAGWSFDVELLARARCEGLKVKEVPIVWRNDAHTRMRVKDMLRMLIDLSRISRMRLRRGDWTKDSTRVADDSAVDVIVAGGEG